MSQVFDLAPPTPTQIRDTRSDSPNISLTVVLAMCAVGIALSLASFALPGWVFQPSDVATFPLP
jgi:hypothetical protein